MADRATQTKVDALGPVDVEVIGSSSEYLVQVDEVSATLTYIGRAAIGSADGAAVWQIQRLNTVGTVMTIAWADGDTVFNNIWNNRGALSYS